MELITGLKKPPLHKNYNEVEALKTVHNRYRNFYESILDQVKLLQKDNDFLVLCKEFYKKGYKDWMILGAVFNLIMNEPQMQAKLNPFGPGGIKNKQVTSAVKGFVVDVKKFTKENMDRYMDLLFITFLKTYEYDLRYPRLKPGKVEKFFRERTNLFNLDVLHKPLFTEDGGEWPQI